MSGLCLFPWAGRMRGAVGAWRRSFAAGLWLGVIVALTACGGGSDPAKAPRAEFGDLAAADRNGAGTSSGGIDIALQAVIQPFKQGSITSTDNPLDIAINGRGLFQLSDGLSLTTYSRIGQFTIDREGFIVDHSGHKLLGYKADPTGQIQPGLVLPLRLPTGISPRPTTSVSLQLNLDSTSPVTRRSVVPPNIRFSDATTYNNTTSLTVYDAKGQPIVLTFYYQRVTHYDETAGTFDTWNVYATANGTPLNGTVGAPAALTRLTFSRDGTTVTAPRTPVDMPIPASTHADGVSTLAIPDPNDPKALPIQLDLSRLTQFGSPFGVTDLAQNGHSAGQLASIAVEPNGIVNARFSNDQTRAAGQIELAIFRNMQGLQPVGTNMLSRTVASGEPMTGVPGEGILGVLQGGGREEPSGGLTGELVSMIIGDRVSHVVETSNPLDAAILGEGYFQFSDGAALRSYGRQGHLAIDRDGFIVSGEDGHYLLGVPADESGRLLPVSPRPLRFLQSTIKAAATRSISMEMNLDSTKPITMPAAAEPTIDFDNADTYNSAISLTVFDAKGAPIALTFYYQRASIFDEAAGTPDTWHVFVTANGTPLVGTPGAPGASARLTFSRDGSVMTEPTAAIPLPIPASVNADGVSTLAIPEANSPNAAAETIKLDLSRLTQFAATFWVSDIRQDGYPSGRLFAVDIVRSDGLIQMLFTNGERRSVGQIQLARFDHPRQLQRLPTGRWFATPAAGTPVVGAPGRDGLGVLWGGALEVTAPTDLSAKPDVTHSLH